MISNVSSGRIDMRIEPISDFLLTTESVSLNNVVGLTTKYTNTFSKNVRIGDAGKCPAQCKKQHPAINCKNDEELFQQK